jgi:hypothetical protein
VHGYRAAGGVTAFLSWLAHNLRRDIAQGSGSDPALSLALIDAVAKFTPEACAAKAHALAAVN